MSEKWVSKYLSSEEAQKIERAIAEAEKSTTGEIVPVIVKSSSHVGHIPLVICLFLILLIVVLELPWSDWLWVTPWIWLWPFVIMVTYALAIPLGKIPMIQKILVPERDEVDQVHQRAWLEFYRNRIHRTKEGTGVLIFVSVMERKAVILADEGIARKLPADTWEHVLQNFSQRLKGGQWAQGFIEAIEKCGGHLKTHFPIEAENENQLKNHLIIKE